MFVSPSRMSLSGRLALPDVRQLSGGCPAGPPDVREWSRDPPGCPGAPTRCSVVVGWLSQMSRSGQNTLPDVREGSGCPPACP